MIEKIAIENYKSFGDKTEIKLGKFNVLVGPNNSGKSNFLHLLSFISELMRGDIKGALNRKGGYKSIVFNSEEDRDISISISMKDEKSQAQATYSFHIGNIRKENPLEEDLRLNEKELIKGENGRGKFWNPKEGRYENFTNLNRLHLGHLLNFKEGIHPSQLKLAEFLEGIEIYNFELPKLREKKEIGEESRLNKDGSNLSQVIHFLRNKDRELYAEFEDMLKAAIPEVKYLETPPTSEKKANLEIVEKELEKRIDLSEMSDGILWFLAHLYALISAKTPSLLCFEEPGNLIHPSVLKLMIETFKSGNSQVIVTTHNPFFVNLIEPEDLIIFEKKEGKTKYRGIEDPKEMKERVIKDIPLGEIWYSGGIGGVP